LTFFEQLIFLYEKKMLLKKRQPKTVLVDKDLVKKCSLLAKL